ncbi:MAG: hypothetical protein ACRDO2_09385 [Nocardioidaceae bacterium]
MSVLGWQALIPDGTSGIRTIDHTKQGSSSLTGVPVAHHRTMTLVEVLEPDGIPLTAVLNTREFASNAYAGQPVQVDTTRRRPLTTAGLHDRGVTSNPQARPRFDAVRP